MAVGLLRSRTDAIRTLRGFSAARPPPPDLRADAGARVGQPDRQRRWSSGPSARSVRTGRARHGHPPCDPPGTTIMSRAPKGLCMGEREISPGRQADLSGWYQSGTELACRGRYERSIAYFDRVLEVDRQHLKVWVSKANSLDRLGRFGDALECCDRALRIDARSPDAWYMKGSVLFHLSHFRRGPPVLRAGRRPRRELYGGVVRQGERPLQPRQLPRSARVLRAGHRTEPWIPQGMVQQGGGPGGHEPVRGGAAVLRPVC